MSKYLGVITWNVHGDSLNSNGSVRVTELNMFLELLQKAGEGEYPVDIICLQETSADGALKDEFEKKHYEYHTLQEGRNEGGYYVFAVLPPSGFTFDGPPKQCRFEYESPTGSRLRYPAMACLTREGLKVAVYTYHATLHGARDEGLMKLSGIAEQTVQEGEFNYVFVSGDLNIKVGDMIDGPTGKENFLKKYFKEFTGASNNLDHTLCCPGPPLQNIYVRSYQTTSDHNLLYSRFKIG